MEIWTPPDCSAILVRAVGPAARSAAAWAGTSAKFRATAVAAVGRAHDDVEVSICQK